MARGRKGHITVRALVDVQVNRCYLEEQGCVHPHILLFFSSLLSFRVFSLRCFNGHHFNLCHTKTVNPRENHM